jgi:hypothetical protein
MPPVFLNPKDTGIAFFFHIQWTKKNTKYDYYEEISMNPGYKTLMILVLALCIMVPYGYAAYIISANPSPISLNQGSTQTATVTVDELPYGLSGYSILVSLADPSAGEIVSVQFPGWAILNTTEGLPNASVKISAVDLSDQVKPGAASVVLAGISIRGERTASSEILISKLKLDGDGDAGVDLGAATTQTMTPTPTTTAHVTANHGSSGYSGGGGSYSSNSANAGTSGYGVTTAPTVVRTTAVQSGTGDSDPGIPVVTYSQSPPAERMTFGPIATSTASQSAMPTLPAGIPGWVPTGTGIVVIIVAGGLMYMTYKKKL